MAFDIGAILGKLVLDSSKWESAIREAKKDAKSLEGAILRNEQRVKKFGVALTATGFAVSALNLKLVTLAATAEESENLFEVSMGRMANAARDWSKELSDKLGLNEYELRRTVGTLNVMVKSMGISEDAAYDMSTSLVQLSQDMASFFNLAPSEAFDKIQSGLVGMSRPLQDLGILVNETTVKEWALTNGLIKQGQELTEQQKVLGRYMVIMEATKAAQGDLERTVASTTNQWRIFSSQISEIGVKLGESLLPSVNGVLQQANKMLVNVENLIDRFPNLSSVIVTVTAALGGFAVVLGGVLLALPGLAALAVNAGVSLGAMVGTLTLGFLKLAGAITAVVLILQNFDTLQVYFQAFSMHLNEMIANALLDLVHFIDALEKLPGVTAKMVRGTRDALLRNAVGFKENADFMKEEMERSADKMIKAGEKIEVEVSASFEELSDNATKSMEKILQEFHKTLQSTETKQKNWLQKIQENFNVYEEMGKRTFNALADSISTYFFDVMTGEIKSITELFAEFGRRILQIISDIIAQWIAMKIITGIAGSIFGTPAVPGVGGYGANTPAGVTNMGTYSRLPGYAEGTDYVPYDMLARVHRGEEIKRPEDAGKGGSILLTIHNLITPEAVASAVQTREGERAVVNIINKDSLRNGTTRREVSRR